MVANVKSSLSVLLVCQPVKAYQHIKKMLEATNYSSQLEWIKNFDKAVQAIQTHHHDIILVDQQIDSQHNVLDLLYEINHNQTKAGVIVLSTDNQLADKNIQQQVLQNGVTDYLNKNELTKNQLERSVRYSLERQNLIAEIHQLINYDNLTHLPNRSLFYKTLKQAVAASVRYKHKSALLLIDIDGFTKFNEAYGRDATDHILAVTSDRLQNNIRTSDYLARIDGTQFAIILGKIAQSHDAGVIAQKICKAVREPIQFNSQDIEITTSIGIVCFPNDAGQTNDLMQCAETALSRVKKEFRGSYQFYRRHLTEMHQRQISIENLLPHCIKNKELYLTYQPIVDLSNHKLIGIEALVRWYSKELNQDVALDQFIPLAEESGLIHDIGQWVIENTGEQLAQWQQFGYEGFLTLNISDKQLFKVNFIESVAKTLKSLRQGVDKIKFEMRETILMQQSIAIEDSIARLHELGIDVFIDRFGSSFFSLRQLHDLKITTIKVDKSITRRATHQDGIKIIEAIIALAKSLGLNIIAEGIETEQQQQALIKAGCLFGQGYLYSKPLIAKQMTQYLKTHHLIDSDIN